MKNLILLFILLYPLVNACNSAPEENIEKIKKSELIQIKSFSLSKSLKEISGLAMTGDGRLFAHNDEKSNLYQIDMHTGKIIKSFSVGDKTIKKDFEGLAIANEFFYLVTSNGDLYEFKEGEDDGEVEYKKYKTFLNSDNDVEGLCFNPKNNSLYLACKGDPGKKYKGNRTVYEFSLINKKLNKKPILILPVKQIMKKVKTDFISKIGEFFLIKDDTFAPSGIEYNNNGNFFILSFKGRIILEVNGTNQIQNYFLLDPKEHRQPEGITFTPDNKFIISDEGAGKKAKITIYRFLK